MYLAVLFVYNIVNADIPCAIECALDEKYFDCEKTTQLRKLSHYFGLILKLIDSP